MQKYWGRHEKTIEYRRSQRGERAYDAWDKENSTHSNKVRLLACASEIDQAFGRFLPPTPKKAKKRHIAKPMPRSNLLSKPIEGVIVISDAFLSPWQIKLRSLRLADCKKLRKTIP